MNGPQLRANAQQQQTLSPRLQRAVRLLQLSSLDFLLEVREAMGRNPFLDGEDDAAADPAGADGDGSVDMAAVDADRESHADTAASANELRTDDAAAAANDEAASVDLPGPADGLDGYADAEGEGWQTDGAARKHNDGGSHDGEASDWMVAATTLSEHLHGQLNVLRLPWRDLALARAVVESLDDDGYLRGEWDEVAAVAAGLGLEPAPDADELQIALRRVQALDPAGVGARSVPECLLLQLAQQPRTTIDAEAGADDAAHALAERIVRDHLQALATQDVERLARTLGADVAAVSRACRRIRALDPRPGWRYGALDTQYVTPDVIVRKRGKRWVATLNQRVVPRLKLNETYAELFHRHRTPANGEMAAQLQEARWTLHNVQQRFATILGVAQAIVDRQGLFLDYGPMAMKPMCLREIADEVGAHPSTVCRVTNNKYMSTPAGVFELKHFFSRALPTSAGGSCSPTALKGLMRDMIAAEDPRHPLSDAQIARQLVQQGLPIVRRTVTKYRQGLAIDVADRRRRTA